MNDVLMISTTIIAIGGAIGVIWTLLRPILKKTQKLMESLDRFTRDWFGEEARLGHKAIPGVLERLQKLENELSHNGGSSMKDSLKRVEDKIGEIDARLEEGNKRFDGIEKRMGN
jgi:hypothetical protein